MILKSLVSLFFVVAFAWTTSAASVMVLVSILVSAASSTCNHPATTATTTSTTTSSVWPRHQQQQRRRILQNMFDMADTNHDGSISRDEAYILVLKWYIKINRRAHIPPPSRQTVNQLFDLIRIYSNNKSTNHYSNNNHNHNNNSHAHKISLDEFGAFATILWRRALIRIVAHKLVTIVGAPLLANWIVAKLSQHATIVARLQRLCKALVPHQFIPAVATKAFCRTVLIILFCVTLGNFVMSRVNEVLALLLHCQETRKKALQERETRTRND
jgi:hypothetical protein